MAYSFLNLRPYLRAEKSLNESYWYLASVCFNITLPSFPPQEHNLRAVFWNRARSVKKQSAKAVHHSSHWREMTHQFRLESQEQTRSNNQTSPPPKLPAGEPLAVPLIGFSMHGNLDRIYQHSAFGNIRCKEMLATTRWADGDEVFIAGYTFLGKLWFLMEYDQNALKPAIVEEFWRNFLTYTDEILVGRGAKL
jgi:hypothetical protein